MDGGDIIQHFDQAVVVLLSAIDGDEFGRRVELVQQLVGVRRTGGALVVPPLPLGAFGFGLQLLGLPGVGRAREHREAAEAAALAILAVALVDHGLSFAERGAQVRRNSTFACSTRLGSASRSAPVIASALAASIIA